MLSQLCLDFQKYVISSGNLTKNQAFLLNLPFKFLPRDPGSRDPTFCGLCIRLRSGKNKHNLSITKAQILPHDELKIEENQS